MMVWAIVGDRRCLALWYGHTTCMSAACIRISAYSLRYDHLNHCCPDRHQGLQLGAYAVARRYSSHTPDVVRSWFYLHVCEWWAHWPVSRERRSTSRSRYLLRRRAFPYGDGRFANHGGAWRGLSLVPEVNGTHVQRSRWVSFILGYVPRGLPDLLPDALHRTARSSAPVSRHRRSGVHPVIDPYAQCLYHHHGFDRGLRPDGVPVQSRLEPVQGQAFRRQSMAGDNSGVADAGDPARARQLGQGAPGGLSMGV